MLVGSILIGALAGFALLNYVQGVEDDVLQKTQRVEVWVVAANVPAGTTASDVQQTGRLELRQIESTFRPSNAVSNLSQIQGRVAVSNLAENQILVEGMFDDPEVIATTFADLIEEDQVAFSLTIDPKRAVGGFIEPGDFVDMIVLGDEYVPPGEPDAFDASATRSPYTSPARYLYRGVRIIGIDEQIVGQAVEDAPLGEGEGEGEASALSITLAVPADAAQRILSVAESDLVLSLLPDGWTPEARPNDIEEDIILDVLLPGEDPQVITPYGDSGFIDELADQLEAENASNSPSDSSSDDEASTDGAS
jgi:Flp pilus assembly protein CpaB